MIWGLMTQIISSTSFCIFIGLIQPKNTIVLNFIVFFEFQCL